MYKSAICKLVILIKLENSKKGMQITFFRKKELFYMQNKDHIGQVKR